jgi:hypothetical protein
MSENYVIRETKGEKLMFFFQVLMGISFLLGLFVTISPYIKILFFIAGFLVLGFITLASGFLLLIWDDFRLLWKKLLNSDQNVAETFFNSGYYLYALSIGFSVIIILYFLLSKKVTNKKHKIIFPNIAGVLVINLT